MVCATVLRAHRKQVADDVSVPPDVVFSDVAFCHMARAYPTDDTSFLAIPGVGERKLADYGPDFIDIISDWLEGRISYGKRRIFRAFEARIPQKHSRCCNETWLAKSCCP